MAANHEWRGAGKGSQEAQAPTVGCVFFRAGEVEVVKCPLQPLSAGHEFEYIDII